MERIIEFTIPDGYTAKNLDDLTINEVYKDGESETMGFVSTYAIEGNKLKVTIKESYNRVFYPRQQYDHFKKVINAAADFNKVVLILSRT